MGRLDAGVQLRPLRWLLPPSCARFDETRLAAFSQWLRAGTRLNFEVDVASSYDGLATGLLSGQAAAAWAPPFVCARLETVGGLVPLRSVRRGRLAYRAALVSRAGAGLHVDRLDGTRAAWVDRQSTGGYLLVAAHLRSRGRAGPSFAQQSFVGSYPAALQAVLAGQADVTSVLGSADEARLNVSEFLDQRDDVFEILAWTEEAPNDGIALAPLTSPAVAGAVTSTLLGAHQDDAGRQALSLFGVDRFEPCPRLAYRALHAALRLLQ